VHLDEGLVLTKAAPRDAVIFNVLRRMSLERLPARPFDLNGTWSYQNGQQITVTQNGDEIALKTDKGGTIFRGRYTSNPLIGGEGPRPGPPAGGMRWVGTNLTVVDPDHLRLEGRILYRFSNPASRDVPCDAQNSNHVKDYYARLRGALAYSEKDYKAARCWLQIGADWGYPAAQSMLAALIIEGKDGTAPDYALAFDLASKSAESGNTAGQFELAGMYRNGEGTPANAEKARFWLEKAQQSDDFAKMRSAMTPEALANGIGTVMGMAGPMVDFNLKMTPPSCFSHDVLGNRAPCK
jgi:hypothetical protein